MIRTALARLFGRRTAPLPPGGDLKALARSPDTAVRQAVAAAAETLPELLYFLARDPVPAVRLAIARNRATPRQADLLLALDEVPEIRTLVAEKIAGEVQAHSRAETAQLWQVTVAVLEALAHDDLASVRALVAQMAHGLDRMPVGLVTRLGRDRIAEVAVPALGYPGTILDDDLVAIVTDAPDPRVIGAVARRPSIGPRVAEKIVESGDAAAIRLLLENRTAEIPGPILDGVVERAPPVEAWHEALVQRPVLSAGAAMRLAGFVADRLVRMLQSRADLDPETSRAIATLLQDRPAPADHPRAAGAGTEAGDSPLARARAHYARGTLSEDVIGNALGLDQDFVIAALALRARLLPAVVNKILVSHSAKGLTALSWKAGYTMRLALQLQIRLARLPPKARLNANRGGSYPLTPDEMEWQIEFFQSLVPAGM
ncbi:MAG: hypothetical protein QOJ54_473 [Aliidongia sp.]|nr:hypothetical protein [Aliidongia sp.]